MDRGIIALCNYVKRKYGCANWWTLSACVVASADRRFTYLRFIVMSNPKINMTHLQSYKAGSPYGIIYFGNITHKKWHIPQGELIKLNNL